MKDQKVQGWAKAKLLVSSTALGLTAGLALLMAQQFRVGDISINPEGKPRVQYPSDTNYYYILYRGNVVTNMALTLDMALGQSLNGEFIDPSAATNNPAAFYRIKKMPIDQPLDSDGDGIDDVYELRHRNILNPLNPFDAMLDSDGDGLSNFAEYRQGSDPAVASMVLTRIEFSSPPNGATEVSVTRETILYFSNPLTNTTLLTVNRLHADFGARRLLSRVELSSDRRKATLFYLETVPGSAHIRVTFDGNGVFDFLGHEIDADGDGLPGGVATIEFDTLSQTPFPNTIVCGRVFASELQNLNNVPLAGVIITADGLEESVRATTDQFGNFRITNAPAGHFFVHIDGRTVTNLAQGIRYPDMAYYPFVGKEWESLLGGETNIGEVFLPRIVAGTLQQVSISNDTVITFPTNVLAQHPELQGVTVTVPPNALFSDNGTRGGMIGIAPVPPDRLPGPLPLGLNLPLVITVQTDGGQNFDRPVPVCFPNLPDPVTHETLPPGARSALWSFDHDTGQWEIRGSMTVSADGRLVCTDPGVGLLSPGWHGTGPGSGGGGGGGCENPPCPCEGPDCDKPKPDDDDKDPNDQKKCEKKKDDGGGGNTDPVYLFSGEFYEHVEDLRIKGVGLDFVWSRTYRSKNGISSAQGNQWDFSYNLFLMQSGRGLRVCNGGGRDDLYRPRPDGTWGHSGFFRELKRNIDQTHTLTFADQTEWSYYPFDGTPQGGKIARITDRNGNNLRFFYDAQGRLMRVTDTLDRDILIAYNGDGFVSSVTDFAGRSIRYEYYGQNDPGGNFGDLKSVASPVVVGTPNGNDFPNGKKISYTYSKGFANDRLNHNLLTITDGRRNDPTDTTFGQAPYLVNIYSTVTNTTDLNFDRVVRQIWGGNPLHITYLPQVPTPENGQAIIRTIVNDRVGNVKEYFWDSGNRCTLYREFTGRSDANQPVTDVVNRPTGKLRPDDPDHFETRFEFNTDYKRRRIIHPNGNITEDVYESELNPTAPPRIRGNLRIVRQLPGTHVPAGDQSVIEELFEYDANFACPGCGFNFVTKHTDGRGNVTLSKFDARGNLTNRIHRITNIVERWEYNARGQMTKHVLPDNGNGSKREDVMTYFDSGPQRGYLRQEIIDQPNFALTTAYEYDPVGNVVRKIDPRGHDSVYAVNALNQIVRETSREVLDGSGIRYHKDYFYDANNNLIRLDVENRRELLLDSGAPFLSTVGAQLAFPSADGGIVATNPVWTTTFEYEALNHLTRKSEEVEPGHNIVTEYTYDASRNRTLTRLGEATAARQPNNVVQMLYDERDLPYREIRAPGDPAHSTRQMDYDRNQNRTRNWQGLEDTPRLTQFANDGFNRLVSMMDAMGNVTTNNYDANGNRVRHLIFGELNDTNDASNLSLNVRLSETAFVYDALNRRIRDEVEFFNATNQAPIGGGKSITSTAYSDTSQVIAVTNANNHARLTAYDSANRQRTVTDAKGNTITYDYDADSNLSRMTETEKADLGGPDEVFLTTFAYDGNERLIAMTDNVGNLTRTGFDSRNDRLLTVDALTNVVHFAYDGLNRLTRTTYEMKDTGSGVPPAAPSIITRQTWDDSTRLTTQIDDNNNATAYLFDALNRKTATFYADNTGKTNLFDVHNNSVRMTDANGNIVTCIYDQGDRLTRKDIAVGPGVSPDTTFEVLRYDGLSRLIHAEDNDSIVARSYDSLSRITRETQNAAVVVCLYDGVGNQTQCKYPSGRVIATAFDELERQKTISETTNGIIATYYFVGPTRVAQRDYGNGTRATWQYDGLTGTPNPSGDFSVKQIIRTTHASTNDGAVLDDRTYTWDRMGNKTRNKDMRLDGAQWQHESAYDSVYRLVHSIRTAPTGMVETITYNLNGSGNRLSVIGGTNSGNYTLDDTLPEPADRQLNQYTTVTSDSRHYDRNGNLVVINTGQTISQNITYDYRDRMAAHTNSATGQLSHYKYDVLGRRIDKSISGSQFRSTLYFYHGWQEVQEQDTSGASQVTYSYGLYIDEILSSRRGSTNTFYHADQLYNVTCVSGMLGEAIERYDYDDYGTSVASNPSGICVEQSAVGNQLLFNGRRFDNESGLYYYRNRYLESKHGRFTTRDPSGMWSDYLALGNANSFAANNPETFLDYLGENPIAIGGAAAGGASAALGAAGLVISAAAIAAAIDAEIKKRRKHGNCTEAQHELLQHAVTEMCKDQKRSCGGDQDCPTLQANLIRNHNCLVARETVDSVCFGSGSDPGHLQEKLEAMNAIKRCADLIEKKCKDKPCK